MSATHELRLKIDAAAAESGARKFRGAVDTVRKAVQSLERDTSGAFTKLQKISPRVDVAPITAAERETRKLGTTATATAAAQMRAQLSAAAALRTSQGEAQRLTQRLTRLGDTAGVDRLNNELAQLQANLSRAQTTLSVRGARSAFADTSSELRRYINDLEQTSLQENAAARAASDRGAELDRLRSKYNPLYSASKAYEAALTEIEQAERSGAISAQLAADARQRAAASLSTAGAQMGAYGQQAQASSFHTANLGYQLNDIAVMMAAGQNPLMLALQQGTQVSQVFNQMGTGVRGAGSAMATALRSVVSPMSLLTIGVIAGGAALFQWGMGAINAGRETRSFEDTIGAAETATSALARRSTVSISSIREQYGTLNAEVREHIRLLGLGEERSAMSEARSTIQALENDMSGFWRTQNGMLQDVFAINLGQANILQARLEQIGQAATFEDMQNAAQRALEHALGLVGGYENANAQQADFLDNLIRIVDNMRLARAASDDLGEGLDGASGAASSAATAADQLNSALASGVGLSAQLLGNLSSVPGALSALSGSVAGQVDAIRSQNRALELQLETGVGATVAGRQVQLEQLVSRASEGGGPVNVDQIANLQLEINELQTLTARQTALQDALSAATSTTSGSGGGADLSDIERLNESIRDRLQSLREEQTALQLVRNGAVETTAAAELLAQAMMLGGGAVDAQTLAMIRQVDAAALLTQQLEQLASDPVREWMDSVPSWVEAAQEIEMSAITGLRDSLADFLYEGEMDLQGFVDSIRRTMADILADQLTNQLLTALGRGDGNGLAGLGGGQSAAMQNAMMMGGQSAAMAMQQAMVTGAQQASGVLRGAHVQGGQSVATATRTAGIATGQSIRGATVAAGGQHARMVNTAIMDGGMKHANAVRGATSGGGGMGGGLMGLLPSVLGMFFEEGGYATSPVKSAAVPLSAFVGAPQYAEGTSNTSGIPAILHPNEAVVPLSRGRKIPVDLGDAKGGGVAITNQVNVTVEGGSGGGDDERLAGSIASRVGSELKAMVKYQIAEEMRYGGALSPRGGGR